MALAISMLKLVGLNELTIVAGKLPFGSTFLFFIFQKEKWKPLFFSAHSSSYMNNTGCLCFSGSIWSEYISGNVAEGANVLSLFLHVRNFRMFDTLDDKVISTILLKSSVEDGQITIPNWIQPRITEFVDLVSNEQVVVDFLHNVPRCNRRVILFPFLLTPRPHLVFFEKLKSQRWANIASQI